MIILYIRLDIGSKKFVTSLLAYITLFCSQYYTEIKYMIYFITPDDSETYTQIRNYNIIVIHTRCLAIAERPRCRVHYSFRQK